jgi:hypothetical protein
MLHDPELTAKNLATLKHMGTNRTDLTKDKNVLINQTEDSIVLTDLKTCNLTRSIRVN